MQPAAMAVAHKQQAQPQHHQQQQGCGSGCTQAHAHGPMRSAHLPQMHSMQQPQLQQAPPPMQQQPAVPMHPHAMMQPPPTVFGPHPLPPQQPQQMLPPHMHPPPQSAQYARPASPPMAAPALDPSLNTFSVQQSHPRFASIHVRCENYEPLRSWLPFIQWDGSFVESYPMQTEFRVPAQRVEECVGVLMRRGFAPMQSRLAARM